jgi:ankyrin repeat and BTB/POZ domain-containing protein 1
MLLRKDQLEASLHEEKKLIESGKLKEDNPLDQSQSFRRLCDACRRGDLKVCQETITEGANVNASDEFDYTPLILVSCAPAGTAYFAPSDSLPGQPVRPL